MMNDIYADGIGNVRLAGTNFEEGKKILEKSGLKILSASDLNDAAKKIVEAIK